MKQTISQSAANILKKFEDLEVSGKTALVILFYKFINKNIIIF